MERVYSMVPPSGSGFIVVLSLVLGLQLALLALFAYLGWSTRNVRFELSDASLRIRGGMYGRTIPRSDLILEKAEAIDMTAPGAPALAARTNGVGLPGCQLGWFRAAGGGKVLAFLTDRRHVVHIPTRAGFNLILSVADPQAFLSALRSR